MQRLKYFRIIVIPLLLLTNTSVFSETLILGVHPYRPADQLKSMFRPLADYLAERLDQPVEIRIGSSYEEHLDAIATRKIDIAYIGPALYVEFVDKYGVPGLLARLEVNGKPVFHGTVIARSGSDIEKLQDIKGRHFAFGSKKSTMSYQLPKYLLAEQRINLSDLAGHRFFGSHDNVAMAVLSGVSDAGAVKEAIFEKYRDRAPGLKAVEITPEISEHLFITPTEVSSEIQIKLKQALLALTRDYPETARVLHPIKNTITALVNVKDSDYQTLRRTLTKVK